MNTSERKPKGTDKYVVSTNRLPAPKGPYSQAIKAGDFLFVSGIVGIEPQTGAIGGDICLQLAQTLNNLRTLLESEGGTLEDVVKTTIFLADMNDYPTVNEIYANYFPLDPPARSTIEAKPPGEFLVEIEAVAFMPCC